MERTQARRSLALLAAALALTVPAVLATGGVVAAQDDGKFCTGTNIVFFPGGTEGGGFETVVYNNGAKAAEAAFGPSVAYRWTTAPETMLQQFSEAVATRPGRVRDRAIRAMMRSSPSSMTPSQGIIVTVMNTELAAAPRPPTHQWARATSAPRSTRPGSTWPRRPWPVVACSPATRSSFGPAQPARSR